MRFGLTLRMDLFTDEPSRSSHLLLCEFGGREGLFSYLKEKVDTVEISTIGSKSDPEVFLNAVKCCKEYGLEVTVHGLLKEAEAAEDFFAPYLPLFEDSLQENYNITLHPLNEKEDTVRVLSELCNYADKMACPVTFTLENQRLTHECSVNGICQSVREIVEKVNHNRLNTCWDFGHYLSNKRKNGEKYDPFDEKFLQKVQHTHIHSMYEGTTHFPLFCGETELDKNLALLIENDFDGILSLELDFGRFADEFGLKESLCRSVEILKNSYHQAVVKETEILRYEKEYPAILERTKEKLKQCLCGVALLSPSSYLLKLGDIKMAVDPSLLDIPVTREGRELFLQLIGECDAVIYTHKHGDHYDSRVATEVKGMDNLWLIPDFFSQNDIRGGNLEEKTCIFVETEKTYKIADVEIKFFESCHSSEDSFVPEYGFAILYEGKHYVFSADVRNYDTGLVTPFPDTEVLFAHLWLGREKALETDGEYIRQFADFVNAYEAKRVCLGHLFDVRREICDMWTDLHYRELAGRIENLSPLHIGDVISL